MLDNKLDIMSTVVNKNIKLDTKIDVPNNFVGLVYYNDKYLFTLQSGEYKFQGDLFYKVVEKNARRNKNYSKPLYNFNIHYINTSRQRIEQTIFVKSTFKQKEEYYLTAIYEIIEPRKFANEILATWYKTTSKRTQKLVNDMFGEFCFKFLQRKLKANKSINEQLFASSEKYFGSFGIKICEINLSKSQEKVSHFFETNSQPYISDEDLSSQPQSIVNDLPKIEANKKYCPNCQSEMIAGAEFCHKCGYKFISFK